MNTPFHALSSFMPAQVSAAANLPWVPSGTPGKSAKLLRFLPDDRGFVELLRMEPGVVMPLHRHTGEIHVYNLSGTRQLCTGEIVGAGDYVYEPNGNTDWWKIVGAQTMLALVVVIGKVAFLDAEGRVTATADAASQRAELERHCLRTGLPMPELKS
jgi:2,4'-dihydroxyacetophenone dioxygenase